MLFGSSKRLKDTTNLTALRVGDNFFRSSDKFMYTGVILDEQLTWGLHIDHISTKIKRNIGAIKRIALETRYQRSMLEMLYKLSWSRILGTATLCWDTGDTLLKRLQAIQNRAARVISLKKYDNTDHERLLKNLKWLHVRS